MQITVYEYCVRFFTIKIFSKNRNIFDVRIPITIRGRKCIALVLRYRVLFLCPENKTQVEKNGKWGFWCIKNEVILLWKLKALQRKNSSKINPKHYTKRKDWTHAANDEKEKGRMVIFPERKKQNHLSRALQKMQAYLQAKLQGRNNWMP